MTIKLHKILEILTKFPKYYQPREEINFITIRNNPKKREVVFMSTNGAMLKKAVVTDFAPEWKYKKNFIQLSIDCVKGKIKGKSRDTFAHFSVDKEGSFHSPLWTICSKTEKPNYCDDLRKQCAFKNKIIKGKHQRINLDSGQLKYLAEFFYAFNRTMTIFYAQDATSPTKIEQAKEDGRSIILSAYIMPTRRGAE